MGRERQRGAIGVMAAITLLMALVCLALVIDTGRLYNEQRKLQRVADMAALEAATLSGMCGAQDAATVQGYVTASAARNNFVPVAGETLSGVLGTVSLDGGYGAAQTRRTFSPGGDMADSVRVQVTHNVPTSLVLNVASLFSNLPTRLTLSAQATARRTAMAGISAGSGVLSLNSSNSPLLNALLGGLLGTTLNLDAVTYQGIAGANISLLALSQQLQAAGVNLKLGDLDSLLNANVSALQLIQAMINAADASQLAGVNTALLRTALTNINVPGAQLTLAQIISVVAPDSVRNSALGADVNLFDLLMATALVANKSHAVAIPAQALSIPGLLSQQLSLTIISPPQIAIGYPGRNANGTWRTQATSTQVSLDVKVGVNLLNLGLVKANVDLKVDVAKGTAALNTIQCGGVGQPVTVTVAASPGVANLTLNAGVDLLSGSGPNSGTSNFQTVSISNGTQGTQFAAGAEQPLTFNVASPTDLPSAAQRVQSPLGASLANGVASLAQNLKIVLNPIPSLTCDLPLVGWLLCPLGKLVNGVSNTLINSIPGVQSLLTGALSSIVNLLATTLIDPLLKLLGIQTGILDVRLIDLQTGGAELLI